MSYYCLLLYDNVYRGDVQEYRFGFESSMSEDLQELEEQLMLKKKKKNATRRMEQIIRLHTEGNRAKLDQARQRESKIRTQTSSFCAFRFKQGVTKRCRLPWLTNSALVYEPNAWGGRGLRGLSQ